MSEKAEISISQEKAILALISGKTKLQAAKAARIAPETLYRWMKKPAFIAALREARDAVFKANLEDLFSLTRAANNTLRRMMRKSEPQAVQIRAAGIVWSSIIRARDLEISEQLENLQAQIQISKQYD